jgi:hypothetical protein
MNTRDNSFEHLTTASELQSLLNDIGRTHGRLSSVLRAAYRIDDNSEESFNDLKYLIDVAVNLAQSAEEQSEDAEALAGGVRQRLEGKPEPGDRLQGETILQMFEAIVRRGEGFSAYRLGRLASILGAHAKHDLELQPVLDAWIGWMAGLGIQTSINKSVQRTSGEFSVGIVSAPGGADAVIGVAMP